MFYIFINGEEVFCKLFKFFNSEISTILLEMKISNQLYFDQQGRLVESISF